MYVCMYVCMLCMCMYASVSCIYVCKANDREICMYGEYECVCVNGVVDECVHVGMYVCMYVFLYDGWY